MIAVVTMVGRAFASTVHATLSKTGDSARAVRRLAPLAALTVAFAACSGNPPAPTPPPAPRVESLAELMHRAQVAAAAGEKDKARDLYRASARAEPASQLPWLKLAESYFDSGDYGNAILAAQEVLQRDGTDIAAATLLTQSGLRVSTSGLAALRQQNAASPVSPVLRGDAETLSKNLRDYLNDSAAATRAAKDLAAPPQAKPRPKPALAPANNAVIPPPAIALPKSPPPVKAPPAPGGSSPFDTLK